MTINTNPEKLSGITKTANSRKFKTGHGIIPGRTDESHILDCYKKLSEKDVPMMKGDCGPRLKTTYNRWDKDLEMYDKRNAGSLPLLRRNTKAGKLAQTYREFENVASDVTLGALRSVCGTIGIGHLRKCIREQGIPEHAQK